MVNVSVVLYHPIISQVLRLCEELLQAKCVRKIFLIDNSPMKSEELFHLTGKISYQWQQGTNLGYGRGHNIAIRESVYYHTPFHLVINADVSIKASDLDELYLFISHNDAIGQLMPKVVYPDGKLQYLCKLLPTPFDVFARRFLPPSWLHKLNHRYELRFTGYDKMMNVPYLSGCFMLLRTQAVLKARLFDERYFMYPEDIDLTRTIHRDYLTVFYPDITIVHDHARDSYHSPRMTWVHMVNMCRYFNKWGWLFDKERRLMNRLTLQSLTAADSPT